MQSFIKVCTTCRAPKSFDEFHDRPTSRDGKQSRCKECQVKSTKKWRRESTDAYLMSGRKTARKNKAYWRSHSPYEENKVKLCPHCKKEKISLDFDESHGASDGLQSWCRACSSERAHLAPLEKVLYWVAKNRAKNKGIEFSISIEDIVIPAKCPVLDIPLYASRGKAGPNSPSLDRIDNTRGYIPGNVCVISYRANLLKNNSTIGEMTQVLAYMERGLSAASARK
jgi:hypothetical protein